MFDLAERTDCGYEEGGFQSDKYSIKNECQISRMILEYLENESRSELIMMR